MESVIERQQDQIIDLKTRSMRDNVIIKTRGSKYKEHIEENTDSTIRKFFTAEMRILNSENLGCQQCHGSVAGPDVGRSAASAEFLFYHSNFVVHQLELKARENCRHRLVDFASWQPRPHNTATLPRNHINDFVH